MNHYSAIDAATIRSARRDNPKMRERDLATHIGVSEAAFLEAWIGDYVERIEPDLDVFFPMLEQAGEVMALSRNESAVHEKTGVYGGYKSGEHASIVLGTDIDLRIFPRHWRHGFHVAKPLEDGSVQHSFQFFDAHGDAVHKVFARQNTDMDKWRAIRDRLSIRHTVSEFPLRSAGTAKQPPSAQAISALRAAWSAMRDTHQFQSILRKSKMSRLTAISVIGDEYAWQLSAGAGAELLQQLSRDQVPVMVFVRNPGMLQIHSGPVHTIKQVGPWLNVMDIGFHLHLRTDRFSAIWLVRKPTRNGDIYSLEIFDPEGEQIIMFNGYRREGENTEVVAQWDEIVQALPRADAAQADTNDATVE
ncbi:hemin-degrading factor [Hoeflea ulvae]|uniref:Hemin-degrading factor n=1 Tax=Hoeflea ulvae TaxID=2983764 RepID=A0ABT3YGD0_9HYPH|nr:ChuX/HutX family heme-like substrate-binding protein [Hoeflea ulvae]MCY0094958.1 hemin-degrading factor [Hoeflea ulvae]